MSLPPDPETEDTRIVRETDDNPVVRFRDLERAIAQVETKIKVGFAVVGAIGVANLLGIRTADSRLPSTAWHAVRTLFAAITSG